MKVLLTISILLCSCVTIPVPPFGNEPGSLGRIEITARYYPNLINAVERFRLNKEQPKPTSSK